MRKRPRRLPLIASMLAGALTLVASASADPPTKETFTSSFDFFDATTCPGITIHQFNEERDTVIEFSATSVHVHRHGVATLTANGKALTSNFSATLMFDPTTTVTKVVGTIYNIQVPGLGTILLDAGNVVFDFSTDPITVLQLGGPHEQLFGDVAGLCEFLADP